MKLAILRRNKAMFLRFTGISTEKFDELYAQLVPIYETSEKKRLGKRERKRAIGGGTPHKLGLDERLLMTLLYCKLYVTHEFLGMLFGLDNSNVSRTIGYISPMLAQIFRVPERKIKLERDETEALTRFFIDGTEQPINRPQQHQKRYYSGKKRRHTVKWQVVTRDGQTLEAVSTSFPGNTHDKKIYDKTALKLPPGAKGVGDTGYLGTDLTQPVKKKKGQQRTKAQRKYNRKISRLRIKAEHAIAKMKRFRVVRDTFRNPLKTHPIYTKVTAGLVNFAAA